MTFRRKFALALWVFAAFSVSIPAQEGKPPKAFAGAWEGKFKDTVFCVLKLGAGDRISGTLSPGKISVNEDGEITGAEPSEPSSKDFPILNPKLEGNKLSFDWKEDDDEVLQFEMQVTGDGEAELRFIHEGGPSIKPIRLKRK